ncbi:hypothetical protein [Rummeliibacillus sp. POC4]|uniref:hypothetical protein n=1 Tax=Rummeliibacillus sp. POC4 TaxID=2305899 RepID=UPI000E6755CA|nr:hypothetical protein [Rummeliibacillus sp. POC4]RIJ65543.1 hypothetical protein D1606_08210 [Rummeliibacillus sp. POC4]
MKFAQILYNKAHWIFEAEEKPAFAPNIILVDITDKPDVQEGWYYNGDTVEFTKPVLPNPIEPTNPAPTMEELQAQTLVNTEYLIAMNEMGIQGGTL